MYDGRNGPKAEFRFAPGIDSHRTVDHSVFPALRSPTDETLLLFPEFVTRLSKLEGESSIFSDQQIQSIEAPTLIIAGDRDPYNHTKNFQEIIRLLRKRQLMIVPGSGHLALYRKSNHAIAAIEEFWDSPHL
jgi:pimeloyl-ACP methyl ester carboxylesterase